MLEMTGLKSPKDAIQSFSAPYAAPDEDFAARWLREPVAPAAEAKVDALATKLVEAIRAKTGGLGGIEDFLHAYSLSTREGLALMVLAEALLRVPDADTANRLIEDKLAAADWSQPDGDLLLISASAWTLGVTARLIEPGETPEIDPPQVLRSGSGLPAIRTAARQAMRLLGSHFVLGQTIDEALDRASDQSEWRFSYDMLGEGARTHDDAGALFRILCQCDREHRTARRQFRACRSAREFRSSSRRLHPRYEATSRERVMTELVPKLLAARAQGARASISISPSMPKKPTGSNCRSM